MKIEFVNPKKVGGVSLTPSPVVFPKKHFPERERERQRECETLLFVAFKIIMKLKSFRRYENFHLQY